MRERRPVTAFAARKGGKKRRNTAAEIHRPAQDCTQLNDNRVHLPVAVIESEMWGETRSVQQRLRKPQVRGRTDRQKFRKTFHDSQNQRQQVVVQSSSKSKGTVSQ